jgi:hypothetical protein
VAHTSVARRIFLRVSPRAILAKACAGLMQSELRQLNWLLSLFGCEIATLGTQQRAPAIDVPTKGGGLAMSGVALLGLAALSAWLAINIAIAVAAVVLDKR